MFSTTPFLLGTNSLSYWLINASLLITLLYYGLHSRLKAGRFIARVGRLGMFFLVFVANHYAFENKLSCYMPAMRSFSSWAGKRHFVGNFPCLLSHLLFSLALLQPNVSHKVAFNNMNYWISGVIFCSHFLSAYYFSFRPFLGVTRRERSKRELPTCTRVFLAFQWNCRKYVCLVAIIVLPLYDIYTTMLKLNKSAQACWHNFDDAMKIWDYTELKRRT